MQTPAEVIASLTGTDRQCVSQRLAAIREWLATPDGQAYVADLTEQPIQSLWPDDFLPNGRCADRVSCDLSTTSRFALILAARMFTTLRGRIAQQSLGSLVLFEFLFRNVAPQFRQGGPVTARHAPNEKYSVHDMIQSN